MKIRTDGATHHEVMVDVRDVLKALKVRLRFVDIYGEAYDHTNHKGIEGIYKIEDVSRHGSPTWEYTLITDKKSDIKAFESIDYLLEYLEIEVNSGS